MSETKHTPETLHAFGTTIKNQDGKTVARVLQHSPSLPLSEMVCTAKRLAAAQDLLEACRHILGILDHPTKSVSIYDADAMRAAIAKAEGAKQ